jgi:FkbM family methyltransferase
MNLKNIPSRTFMKIYKKLSSKYQRRLIFILVKLNLLPPSIRSRVNYRGKFKVKLSNNSSFKMINYGGIIESQTFSYGLFNTWEGDVGWIWNDLCKISQVIFDVGAHTGIYGLVAKAENKKSKVYAFEPSPDSFRKLKTNVELNKYDIILEQFAVSNSTGMKIFYDEAYENGTSGSLSVDKLKNASWYKGGVVEYNVQTLKLCDYIEKNLITRLDLMKLDIEMHEPEALEGLGKYLLEFKPVIIIEVLTNEMAKKLNTFFHLENYKLFHLKNSHKAEPINEFKMFPSIYETQEWNYLLFHSSLEEKLKKETSLYQNLI